MTTDRVILATSLPHLATWHPHGPPQGWTQPQLREGGLLLAKGSAAIAAIPTGCPTVQSRQCKMGGEQMKSTAQAQRKWVSAL